MPEQQTEATPTEVSIDSAAVPFADFVKARREGKTTAIPAENSAPAEVQEQEPSDAATDKGAAKAGTDSEPEPSSGKQRSQGGFQRRIDKLTARTKQLESELEQARRGSTTQPPAQQTQQPKADERPIRSQFDSDDAYTDARIAWGVRQGIAAERQAEQQRAEQERAKQVVDSHHQRVSEAHGRYEDFDEVLQASKAEVAPAAAVYIQRLDNGPDVMYHLASNPELAEEIQDMEPIDQVGALGRISAELRKGSEPKPRKEKPESRAPEPISPVAANTKSSPTPLGEMSFMDYKKAREAGRSR
jgi:hypothetical protein